MKRADTKQRGQGMTEYIIVSETLYPCGFRSLFV